jgi:hypothetical protein
MAGILGGLPPGLQGWVLADQINQQKQAGKMQELQGILSMQGALRQQEVQEKMLPLQMQLLQAQADKAVRPENPFAKVDTSKYTPESVRKFEESGGRNYSILEPVREKKITAAGLAYDPFAISPGDRLDVTSPHESWVQNVQFPTTQQVDRARLGLEGQRVGIDRANLFFNTGMAPMGGGAGVPPAPGSMPSAMDGRPAPVAAPGAPAPRPMAGVVPPRGAPVAPQQIVPPNAVLGQPGQPTLPPRMAMEAELDRRRKENELGAKRDFNLSGIGSIISEAETLLAKGPTSSGIGAAADMAGRVIGYAPPGANEAAQLEAVAGALVAKMPRMEGPQSDFDVKNYREMAGQVGDRTLPLSTRKAALDEVKRLWVKYDKEAKQTPGDSDIGAQVKALGVSYEPNLYDYRIVNGQVQRKKK